MDEFCSIITNIQGTITSFTTHDNITFVKCDLVSFDTGLISFGKFFKNQIYSEKVMSASY